MLIGRSVLSLPSLWLASAQRDACRWWLRVAARAASSSAHVSSAHVVAAHAAAQAAAAMSDLSDLSAALDAVSIAATDGVSSSAATQGDHESESDEKSEGVEKQSEEDDERAPPRAHQIGALLQGSEGGALAQEWRAFVYRLARAACVTMRSSLRIERAHCERTLGALRFTSNLRSLSLLSIPSCACRQFTILDTSHFLSPALLVAAPSLVWTCSPPRRFCAGCRTTRLRRPRRCTRCARRRCARERRAFWRKRASDARTARHSELALLRRRMVQQLQLRVALKVPRPMPRAQRLHMRRRRRVPTQYKARVQRKQSRPLKSSLPPRPFRRRRRSSAPRPTWSLR